MFLFTLMALYLLLRWNASSFAIIKWKPRNLIIFFVHKVIFTVNWVCIEYLRRHHFSMFVVCYKIVTMIWIGSLLICASNLSSESIFEKGVIILEQFFPIFERKLICDWIYAFLWGLLQCSFVVGREVNFIWT